MANVVDRDLGLNRFIRQMQFARTSEVIIGVLEGSNNPEGENIADYAAKNEFGTREIPERSFMRSTFDENEASLSREINTQFSQVQAGRLTAYAALSTVGEKHKDQIKRKVGSNIPPANSPRTIAAKGSSRTLIDTAAMINSINYAIR